MPAPAGEGRHGAEAALATRKTTVPLSPTQYSSPVAWDKPTTYSWTLKPVQGLYKGRVRALQGLYKGFKRDLQGLYKGFTRALQGLSKGFTRALKGLYKGFTRALKGLYKGFSTQPSWQPPPPAPSTTPKDPSLCEVQETRPRVSQVIA